MRALDRHRRAVLLTATIAFSLIVFLACGEQLSPGSDVEQPDAEAKNDDGVTTTDAAVASDGSCDPSKGFNPPALVVVTGGSSDVTGARLSPDERTLYFARVVPLQGFNLAIGHRSDRFGPFGDVTEFTPAFALTDYAESWPSLSADGLELFFERTAQGKEGKIYMDLRTSPDAAFPLPPTFVTGDPASNDTNPFRTVEGDLYFASDRTGQKEIFHLPRLMDGGFGEATPVTEINSPAEERAPVLSYDLLTIYWASYRAEGKGSGDVWRADRSSPDAAFTTVIQVAEVNGTDTIDMPTWLSPDNCHLYMTRVTGGTVPQIMMATRQP